ncbi:MAG: cysteine synthase A [Proteobacteria bacterium]|nr:MAG: cysteine synthase A [Pseudomonadota bacterium]
MNIKNNIIEAIGHTDLIKIPSLSELTGSHIYLKCEYQNPGGSIKDRAARQMVLEAIESGQLKPGMTIVEGTAGNTGIGLALVARALGFNMLVVMPKGQSLEKQRLIELYGAQLKLVDPCPFADPNHFYHTAKRLADQQADYWWADQFENTANAQAHYNTTGPEIWQQTDGRVSTVVSVSGTGGTIAGVTQYLKKQNNTIKTWLVDPDGSGLYHYLKTGQFKASGDSFTEGIGIMRAVANFKQAQVDCAINLPDQDLVALSRHLLHHDSILLGSSGALNVAGAIFAAAQGPKNQHIVTFACDLGERSFSKLYNPKFLQDRHISLPPDNIQNLFNRYKTMADLIVTNS